MCARDNELGVGDNEDTLSEAAEGRGTRVRTLEDHVVCHNSLLYVR